MALVPATQAEVEEQFALTAITKLITLVAEAAGPLGEGVGAVGAAVGIVQQPGWRGAAERAGRALQREPLPAAQQFLEVMTELQSLAAQGNQRRVIRLLNMSGFRCTSSSFPGSRL